MKVTIEFTLPDEQAEYADAVNGWMYRVAIQDALNEIKRLDDTDGEVYATLTLHEIRKLILTACKERGFDPWDGP